VSEAIIRQAERADLPRVGAMWLRFDTYQRTMGLSFPQVDDPAAAWLGSFERTLGRFSFLWVAEMEAELCGFNLARLKRTPPYLGGVMVGEISDLWVEESARNQGIAARLAAAAIQQLKEHGVHSIEVQVLANSDGALKFWQKQGFAVELVQVRMAIFSKGD
jgi:ribosomal protein S18 acetylase RimI-like enzyme